MTENNMRKMYDNFIKLGLTEKAEAISNIKRYAHFKDKPKEEKKKKVK